MTPTNDSLLHALARGARIACIAGLAGLLLAGCATTPQESDPPLALSRTSTLTNSTAPRRAIPADSAQRVSPTLARAKVVRTDSTPDGLPLVEVDPPTTVARSIDLTDDTDDLLQRLRNGFSMPDINNDLVLSNQQWYLNRPDYLRRVLERSSRYMHFIVEELDKRGMPMELALLPMVESAYNPMALSRAKASGLWQFIPATGKRYNLDQNWWKDDRRDIVASTTAALDYLQSIYDMHGDWHLALASYNWGEGAVGRAIAKNQAQGLPTDYLSLNMPAETRNYVPKLQALKNIFRNPALLAELNLPRIPNRPYFATVTKTANIDVKVAAQLAEMPVQEFVALNPAHNRPVIQSDTTMVIPADKIDTFLSNLQVHEENNKPLSSWQAYTMRPGDRLEKIAPRFGMTVANLKEANGIQGRMKLGPGYTLLVAGKDGGGIAPLPEQPRLPVADPEPRNSSSSSSNSARTHTVRKGETLPAIAKHYGVSVAEIRRTNHLRSDKVAVGDVLALATADDTRSAKSPAGKAGAATKDVKTAKATTEKVEKTEKIARSEVAGKNSKASPAGKTAQVAAKAKAPRTARYTVRRGDTLSSIARQFNVDKDDLLRWNHLSPNVLTPGKTLTIELAQNP